MEDSVDALRVRIPTAIAPRYVPPIPDDDQQVTLAARLSLPWTDRVPYGTTVTMVLANPEFLRQVTSPSHPLSLEFSELHVVVKAGSDDVAMNRDFILDVALTHELPFRAWSACALGNLWLATEV